MTHPLRLRIRRGLIAAVGCSIVSWLALPLPMARAAAKDPAGSRPNVVVVLLDNLGQEWLGCYGSSTGKTPHLDRLAASGVRVEHCYTPPVCGPSRIVLLTGRYPFRTGYTLHHDAGLYGGGGLDPVRDLVFANVFRAAGYRTGVFGKWQINDLYAESDVLARHGFETHVVWPDALDRDRVSPAEKDRFDRAVRESDVATTQSFLPLSESRYWNPVVLRDGQRQVLMGQYGPDVFQASALEFLRQHQDEPFLLYYPMVLTHGQSFNEPVVPTPLNRSPDREEAAVYADMVQYADRLIGELVAELERLKLRDNTLLVVATDNGSEGRLTAIKHGRPVRGGLYTLTEAGSDVALVFNCPGVIPGGRTVPLADFSDIFPTLCQWCNLELPPQRTFDGRSLASYLRGTDGVQPPRDWIFNQYHTRRVVRDVRFKLYSTGELFDVARDPDEAHNLADSKDPEVAAARARLNGYLAALPLDAPPPFKLLSQSAFKLRQSGQLK